MFSHVLRLRPMSLHVRVPDRAVMYAPERVNCDMTRLQPRHTGTSIALASMRGNYRSQSKLEATRHRARLEPGVSFHQNLLDVGPICSSPLDPFALFAPPDPINVRTRSLHRGPVSDDRSDCGADVDLIHSAPALVIMKFHSCEARQLSTRR